MSIAASPPASEQDSGFGPIVVMGVSGCGKSYIGERIAKVLACPFIEGDAFHSPENVEKMRRGVPLDDEDRRPWLESLGRELRFTGNVVLSCSALKRAYRGALRTGSGRRVTFLYLAGDRAVLAGRITGRRHDYMPLSLLDSQLATLEVPTGEDGVVTLDLSAPPKAIVASEIEIITAAKNAAETAK